MSRGLRTTRNRGKVTYLWAYAPGAFETTRAVVYDFCESRAGEHARDFLGDWKGSLICDDYVGYKQGLAQGLTEVGCLAHARRKFFDLHAANKSQIAEFALQQFAKVYAIEREVKDFNPDQRTAIRQQQTKPLLNALHEWMTLQREKVPNGSATAKALDYNLRRWEALTRFVDDGQLPVDNNWIENQIRPIALGRANWLFAGTHDGVRRRAPGVRGQKGHDLAQNRLGDGVRQIQGAVVAVVRAEVQADTDPVHLHLALGLQTGHHLTQVVIEVVSVVGQRCCTVGRAAIGYDQQQAPAMVALHQSLCGPPDRFAVHAFAEQVALEQGAHGGAGAAPRCVAVLKHQVGDFVEPAGMGRSAGALPAFLGLSAVPCVGGEAQHLGDDTDLVQRPGHHVDQDRHRLDVLAHRA